MHEDDRTSPALMEEAVEDEIVDRGKPRPFGQSGGVDRE